MEAPDKIYVEISHPISAEYTEIIGFDAPEKNTIEYIRKDAILDKLKTQRDKCVYRSTYWDFYQAIITEIKAL